MRANKRHLIGRVIVDVEMRPFKHFDKGGPTCHNPALILDNGRRVFFVTEETGGPEYGTCICITEKPERRRRAG